MEAWQLLKGAAPAGKVNSCLTIFQPPPSLPSLVDRHRVDPGNDASPLLCYCQNGLGFREMRDGEVREGDGQQTCGRGARGFWGH